MIAILTQKVNENRRKLQHIAHTAVHGVELVHHVWMIWAAGFTSWMRPSTWPMAIWAAWGSSFS